MKPPVDFSADRGPSRHPSHVSPVEVEAVARAMRPRCVQWARRRVRSGAEDVAQAALEALVRHAAEVELGAAVAWLQRTVHLQGLQYLRARGDDAVTDAAPERADESPDPEHALAMAEVAACVQQALAAVGPQRRAVIAAVLLEDRSVADVAREQRIPLGTAHTRLHAGAAELREELTRVRRAEQRRSKGSTSWGVLLVWCDGLWRRAVGAGRAGRGVIAWGAAGVLVFGLAAEPLPAATPGRESARPERGQPYALSESESEPNGAVVAVVDELPARVFESEPLQMVTALPWAERGAMPARVGELGERRRHDAPARMLRERVEQARPTRR